MEITAMPFGPAKAPEVTASAAPYHPGGFAKALGNAQSGAPTGSSPPSTGAKVAEEVAKPGPNAQSQKPDSPPKSDGATTGQTAPVDLTQAQLLAAELSALTIQAVPVAVDLKAVPQLASQVSPTIHLDVQGSGPDLALGRGETGGKAVEAVPIGTPAATPTFEIPSAPQGAPGNALAEAAGTAVGLVQNAAVGAAKDATSVQLNQIASQMAEQANIQTATTVTTSAVSAVVAAPVTVSVASDAGTPPVESVRADSNKPSIKGSVTVQGAEARAAEGAVKASVDKVEGKAGVLEVDDSKKSVPNPAELRLQTPTEAAASVKTDIPQPAEPITRTDLNLVVRQITDRMELMAATRPRNGVTVQLQPAHLGNITMTIKSLAGGIEANISASNDNVRSALEQNRAMLGQSLAERGIRLDNVQVTAQAQQTPNSTQRQAGQQPQQQAQHQAAHAGSGGFAGLGGDVSMTTHQARQTVRNVDGVDLWI
jgi:hypothetical protein